MREIDSMEKHVRRKLLIAKLAQELFRREPGTKSVSAFGDELVDFNPLLGGAGTLQTAVERMKDELAPDFHAEIKFLDGDNDPADWILIKMNDPEKLERYITEKEVELAEVEKEERRHAFALDEDGNLYLVDSDLQPYSIERGSIRHKTVYYLAKHGGYMSAAKIGEKVGSNPKRIRTTVGQLRKKIGEQFGVPGTDLIQSRDTGSYCAGKILLRVPKGYTP
ncbi:hypothetical protein KKH15_02410 [Patescibacteria group bacterium]|nr:hypothetical protein [Patescibacteria group bacterium]MBU1755104.1 hypothetical protein [Patescibacteria group bacterium]